MAEAGFDLIVGLGMSGLSAAAYLRERDMPLRIMDSRDEPPGLAELRERYPRVPLHLGGYRRDWIKQSRRLILSPGVSPETPLVAEAIATGKEVIGDIELFARVADAPIAAITGSNAKSTVTTLLAAVANACGKKTLAGGNLAPAALDLLDQAAELYVLELSSFQLETTFSLRSKVACVLNVSADHLDRHHSMAAYIAAKQRVYSGCEIAVWNRDDAATRPPAKVARQVSFGEHIEADYRLDVAAQQLCVRNQPVLALTDLKLRGHHNALNVLAVLAMSEALGLPQAQVLQAVVQFAGLPHRCQLVGEAGGIAWFNDSKGTNVGATLAALNGVGAAIDGRIILLAGGQGKGQDFTPLAEAAKRYVRVAILFGEDADKLAAGLGEQLVQHRVASLAAAVALAHALAKAGDAVLLSPACASFDMFSSYVDRGEQFTRLVAEVTHA